MTSQISALRSELKAARALLQGAVQRIHGANPSKEILKSSPWNAGIRRINELLASPTMPAPPPAPAAVAAAKHEVQNFVVISTTHLTNETARFLDSTESNEWPCVGGPYSEYGYFIHVSGKTNETARKGLPEDLVAIMQWADRESYQYLLLDRDGEQVEELPAYDW